MIKRIFELLLQLFLSSLQMLLLLFTLDHFVHEHAMIVGMLSLFDQPTCIYILEAFVNALELLIFLVLQTLVLRFQLL